MDETSAFHSQKKLIIDCPLRSRPQGAVSHLCQMVNKQLYQLIEYARRTPHFAQLQREDQITLLRAGWNELLIATVAWRSIEVCVSVCESRSSSMFRYFNLLFVCFDQFPVSRPGANKCGRYN